MRAYAPFQERRDYAVPLLELLAGLPRYGARKRTVLARFEAQYGHLIALEHWARQPGGSLPLWQFWLTSLRVQLGQAGLLDAPRWGVWRITPTGLQWLEDHPSATHLSPSGEAGGRGRPRRVPGPGGALSFTVQGHRLLLSPEQVTAVAREALANGLPPEATRYHSWAVVVDGQRLGLRWLFQEVTGLDDITTYQARHVLERLGFECVREKGGGRVARRSRGPAGEEAAWLEAARREVDTIRALLAGRAPLPSHEKLCDMVQFCYTLELYREASSLFRLVDRDSVHPWLYERTRRVAAVCEGRASS